MKANSQQFIRIGLFIVIAIIALLVVVNLWRYYNEAPWTRDGRIRGDVMRIAPDVSGLVTDVLVQDNQLVKKGQVLFHVDTARYQLAVEQAKANLETAQANLANSNQQKASAQANIAQSQAGVTDAQAQAERASKDLARMNQLQDGNAISKKDLDSYQAAQVQATANLQKAKAGVEVAKESLNTVSTNKQSLMAQVDNATTALHLAELNLQRTEVRAPADGTLSNFDLKAGNYVASGQAVAALIDRNQLYVEGYFEETKLEHIHPGDPATINLMGDSRQIKGHVQGVAIGIDDRERSASGSMLANINPTFNWVRLAQRIPVRINLDNVPDPSMLVSGRTVTVHIHDQQDDKKANK